MFECMVSFEACCVATRVMSTAVSPGCVGQRIADLVGGLRKILVDDTFDLSVRLEARRHDVGVGDRLEKQP